MHPCSLQDPDQHAQAFLAAQPQIEPGASSISQQHCQPYTAYPIGHIQDDQGKSCKLTRIEQRASALPLRPDHPHMQQYRQTLLSQPDAALQRAYCQQQFGQHMTNQQQQETKQALMLAQYSGADICQASLLMALTCMVLLLLLLLAASQQRCKHCGGVPTGPIGSDTHHHTFNGDMHAWQGLITAISGWAATAAADAVSSSCADASISSCKVSRDSSRIQRKMMPTVSRKLLQMEVGASTRPQRPDVSARAAAANGTNEQDLAAIAALETLAADATAASAVMLKALPRIWVQAYPQQQQQHKQLQAQQKQSAARTPPPEVRQVVAAAAGVPVSAAPVSQASNSGSGSPGSSTKGVATLPAAVTTAQLPALGTSSTIHGSSSSSSSSGAGGDGPSEPQVVAYTSPPSITTATPVSGSSSSSSSSSSTGGSSSTSSSSTSGGGEPRVVTYTGPPSTAAVAPITASSSTVSSTGSGIQISTSTPVTVINPINVTTPLSQTTVQQSGGLSSDGVGEALVIAAALRPRLVVVPVFLPGG